MTAPWAPIDVAGVGPSERPDVEAPARQRPAVRLGLTRGFDLSENGRPADLPRSAQRLLALLALLRRPALRSYVAATLWLDSSDERALANLRSALWRLRRPGVALVVVQGDRLALAPEVEVDVRDLTDWAHRVEREEPVEIDDEHLDRLLAADDILPDWYDDEWVAPEREQFRQLRLHALEACCIRLAASRRFSRAIEMGLAAIAGESLRESAHRAVIRVHLAEGNVVAAIRQYETYRRLLHAELGLEPSPLIRQLVGAALVSPAPSWVSLGGGPASLSG